MKPSYFGKQDQEAWTVADWIARQKEDDLCKRIKSQLKVKNEEYTKFYYTNNDELICKKAKTKDIGAQPILVVPESLRAFILNRFHTLPVSAHRGRNKTRKIVKQRYYWPKIDDDVARWIRACTVCNKRKTPRSLNRGNPAIVSDAKRRWQSISIDLVEAGSTSLENYSYILTVIDLFSRYVIAIPLKSKKAKDVAEGLFTHVLQYMDVQKALDQTKAKNSSMQDCYDYTNIGI